MAIQLQQFVTETLNQILRGVADAQVSSHYNGIVINPTLTHYTNPKHPEFIGQAQKLPPDVAVSREGKAVVIVHFDVAVTTSEGTGTKGGIGVFVGAVGLGSHGQSSQTNTSESRVKFRVPVILPAPAKSSTPRAVKLS